MKIPNDKRTYTFSHRLWLFEIYAKTVKKKRGDGEEEERTLLEKMFACCIFVEDEDDVNSTLQNFLHIA
jgi:hypothetical protein